MTNPQSEPISAQAREQFKDAMAELASGVCLLTVRRHEPELDLGMTVTSLASASLEPPMVTVGIGRGTSLAPFMLPGIEVGLSLLSTNQQELAAAFSRKGRPSANELLASEPHHRGPLTGALLADEGLATMEGCVDQTIIAGDHMLVVIKIVESVSSGSSDRALVYHRRGYLDVD